MFVASHHAESTALYIVNKASIAVLCCIFYSVSLCRGVTNLQQLMLLAANGQNFQAAAPAPAKKSAPIGAIAGGEFPTAFIIRCPAVSTCLTAQLTSHAHLCIANRLMPLGSEDVAAGCCTSCCTLSMQTPSDHGCISCHHIMPQLAHLRVECHRRDGAEHVALLFAAGLVRQVPHMSMHQSH